MKLNRFLAFTLAFLSLHVTTYAQQNSNIKTFYFTSNSHSYTPFLKQGETAHFSFDDLDADQKDFYYRITHMTYDWEPSALKPSEYIKGYQSDRIRNFENSTNTLQFYTHYKFQLPNQNTQITRTGNYLIEILDDYDQVVAHRRISIYQPQAAVALSVHKSRQIQNQQTHQNLEFSISYQNLRSNEPNQDFKIALLQNGDWNNAIFNIRPQYISKNTLIYKYSTETNFYGSNEFLHFDSKYLRTANDQINTVLSGNDVYQTILYPDEVRAGKIYTYNPDINGGFEIRMNSNPKPQTTADYTEVEFSLRSKAVFPNNIYVYGGFNNYQLLDENKLVYDQKSQTYKVSMRLKQGFYNYKYLATAMQSNPISGDFYQTENQYQVLVYFQTYGNRYYEIIGFGEADSEQLRQ